MITLKILAAMVKEAGYDPFIWEDFQLFNNTYRAIQVNPIDLYILLKDGTEIEVGAFIDMKKFEIRGGTTIDLANPDSNTAKIKSLLEKHDAEHNN